MDNLQYLFAAYTIIWLLIFGYMFSISKRQQSLEKEIEMLKEMQGKVS